jgi:hypothetical protein
LEGRFQQPWILRAELQIYLIYGKNLNLK